MTTTATRPTDEQIQRDVLEELNWDTRVRPNEVGVSVKDGVVTLSGWVDSFTKKWSAERAALRVRGVRAVANDIEVRLLGAAVRTDPDIAAAARRTLDSSADVPTEKIKVTVSKGWITLEGDVDWEHQRRAAERAVRGLPGVRGVSNLIVVRPSQQPSKDEIKRRIEDALVRNAETDASRISVEVDGDRMILTGTVRSWAERREAERVAWSAPGTRKVDNRIQIQP